MIHATLSLLWTLTAVPPQAGPAPLGHLLPRAPAGAPRAVRAGQTVAAPPGGPRTLLLKGGCLVRLGPRARVRLSPPAPATRCAAVTLLAGRVALVAPPGRGDALVLRLGTARWRWGHGLGTARHAPPVRGVCLQQGRVTLPRSLPRTPPPAKGAPATALSPGRCAWLDAHGVTVSTATRPPAVIRSDYAFAAPRLPVRLDLAAEVARLDASVHGSAQGDAGAEGGGQSMCLDSGGEGSATDAAAGSGVDIAKPLPPTRLRLRVTLPGSGR